MNFEELVAITGMPGLYKVVSNRSNGLVVLDLSDNKKSFVSSRQHQFTPLASISVYIDDESETVPLYDVFDAFYKLTEGGEPIIGGNVPNPQLAEYFGKALPNYDRDRVHIGDMKKIVKWFSFLQNRTLWPMEKSAPAVEEPEAEDAK